MQVGKELAVDKLQQVVTGQRVVVVGLATWRFGRSPDFPAVVWAEDGFVLFAVQRRLYGLVGFQRVEVFEKQQPGGLFGVVRLAGAARILVQDVVDILESLFKQGLILFALQRSG